jgi:hypothetical protein
MPVWIVEEPREHKPCYGKSRTPGLSRNVRRAQAVVSGLCEFEPSMNVNLTAGVYILLGATVALGAQSSAPSADEIARTIGIALKVGTSEPLTDAEKQYGFGLRLLDRQGPVITTLQGPVNRVFTDARNAVARHKTYTPADVTDAAREAAIIAIVIPNNTYQFWDTRGPVRVSEVVFKAYRAGSKDPQVIHPPRGCLFSPLEYKKPSGELFKSQLAMCKFPLDVFSSADSRFEVAVIHDQGEWSRALQPEELRLVR